MVGLKRKSLENFRTSRFKAYSIFMFIEPESSKVPFLLPQNKKGTPPDGSVPFC